MSENLLNLLLADEETRTNNCMLGDGLDQRCYQMQKDRDVARYRNTEYDHVAGYFHLRNIFETNGLKGDNTLRRLNEIFTPVTGGQGEAYDANKGIEGSMNADDRFNAAFAGSYASIYRELIDNGDQVYEDLRKTAWHVYGKMQQKKGEQTLALKETLNILFGDTVLERKGGVELPNGLGTWHDREEMNKRGITLDMIEDNKVNAFYHIYNKHGADLMFEPYKDMDKNWDKVADEMLNGGGNIWWTVINDVETDGYRVVMVGQRGEADRDEASIDQGGYSQMGGIKIIGDAYYDDGTGAKPIRLTKDEFFNSMGEAAAAEHANSQLDWWDSMHWWFNKTRRFDPKIVGVPTFGGLVNFGLDLEDSGALTPGPDMSRKRIKYYMDKLGPGTQHYKTTTKTWTPYDTGFGTDFGNPGRLEIDLFYKPLWDDIQTFEAAKRRSGKGETEVTSDELVRLARQRYRGMFKGRGTYGLRRAFSMYDRFHLKKGMGYKGMSMEQLRGSVNPTGVGEQHQFFNE
tara:strand:+ start:1 stop:1548 length:1548 start_codon:yes stop_codon:yes gene_type:complete